MNLGKFLGLIEGNGFEYSGSLNETSLYVMPDGTGRAYPMVYMRGDSEVLLIAKYMDIGGYVFYKMTLMDDHGTIYGFFDSNLFPGTSVNEEDAQDILMMEYTENVRYYDELPEGFDVLDAVLGMQGTQDFLDEVIIPVFLSMEEIE